MGDWRVVDLEAVLAARDGAGAAASGEGGEHTWARGGGEVARLCAEVAESLRSTGCVVVRDPRVAAADNARFLDMMERYFAQDAELKMAQARPELHYQVGVTPEGTEVPRCQMDPACIEEIRNQPAEHRAQIPEGADPKWRYFWRAGARPAASETNYRELNAAPVVPDGFAEWTEVMDRWGGMMIAAVETVAAMAEVGFELEPGAFTSRMHLGPHLLAPTGTDLSKHNKSKQVFAGYHYDLNFLTIHGKARFPGLYVWLRDGRRIPVKVPEGCLLIQAGKQFEWLTGGHVRAGMHEVIYSDACAEAVKAARTRGQSSLWRVSSTLFGHIASDVPLQPLGRFAHAKDAHCYPTTLCGDYVQSELEAINLKGQRIQLSM